MSESMYINMANIFWIYVYLRREKRKLFVREKKKLYLHHDLLKYTLELRFDSANEGWKT
jgi:hypothetical protein